MQGPDNINDPQGIDEMLKQAFLDLDMSKAEDSKLMDEMAAQVLGKEWPLAGKQAKKPWQSATSLAKGWIWILSGVAVITGLALTALLLTGGAKQATPFSEANVSETTNEQPIAESTIDPEEEVPVVTTDQATGLTDRKEVNIHTLGETKAVPVKKSAYHFVAASQPVLKDYTTAVNAVNPATMAISIATASVTPSDGMKDIPADPYLNEVKQPAPVNESTAGAGANVKPLSLLSAEELEKHKKELKTLDDSFTGMKFSDYSKIKGEKLPLPDNFFLKKTEVTIKEYKLFLTDLLANGKTKEYDIAKPKLDNIWKDPKDRNNRVFLEMYFKKTKFENNPIICISTEAMEMYCSWMKERIESYYKRSGEKIKFTVRLPEADEWKYIASEGRKRHRYGTANGKLKDDWLGFSKNWNANFIETQEKFVAVGDSLVLIGNDKTATTHKVSKTGFIGPARAYPAVMYDVFNMSGNVSEIVVYSDEKGNRKYRSIGGNWNSTGNYLKIDAPDEFQGNTQPSPYIGFRPAIVLDK